MRAYDRAGCMNNRVIVVRVRKNDSFHRGWSFNLLDDYWKTVQIHNRQSIANLKEERNTNDEWINSRRGDDSNLASSFNWWTLSNNTEGPSEGGSITMSLVIVLLPTFTEPPSHRIRNISPYIKYPFSLVLLELPDGSPNLDETCPL